jgi:hypothetical protein
VFYNAAQHPMACSATSPARQAARSARFSASITNVVRAGEIADLDRNPSNQAGIGDHAEHWRSGLPERHKRIILTMMARSALAWRLGQRLAGSA